MFTSSVEGESSRAVSCSSFCIDNSDVKKMLTLPDLLEPKLLTFEPHFVPPDSQSLIPFPPTLQDQLDFTFPSENQDLLARFDDPYFDMFGSQETKTVNGTELPIEPLFLEQLESCRSGARVKLDNSITPDYFFDDFPADVFDPIDSLPRPPAQ